MGREADYGPTLMVDGFKSVLRLACGALLAASLASGALGSPVSSVWEARRLPREALDSGVGIEFEGVVLVHHLPSPTGEYSMMFVHDGTEGIFVNARGLTSMLASGTRVRVAGVMTAGDFAPAIGEGVVEVVGEGTLPPARETGYDELLSGKEDSQWIRISGIICGVSLVDQQLRFDLAVGSRELPVFVSGYLDAIPPEADLVDASVTVTGAGLTGFNPKGQILSGLMLTPSMEMIEVDSPPTPVESVPERSIDRLLSFHPDRVSGHRVKVRGVVTHCDSTGSVFLRSGDSNLQTKSRDSSGFQPGTMIEAVGFPKPGLVAPVLDHAVFRVVGKSEPPVPVPVTNEQAMSGDFEAGLVTIGGQVVEQTIRPAELRLLMGAGETVFPAQLALLPGQTAPKLEIGSQLELKGIVLTEGGVERREGVGFRPTAWHLMLRGPEDIEVIRRPSWWTVRHILTVVAALAVVLLLAFLWIVVLRRRVAAQTAAIHDQTQREATLEERNRIARELHDTFAQGFAGTAFTLEGISTILQNENNPVREHVDLALKMVRHSLTEARRSVMNLRSEALEDRNLADALEETTRNLIGGSSVGLKTDLERPPSGLPQGKQFHLFRIGVEAVTNALRHGDPTEIQLSLKAVDGALRLEVSDDGAGFDPAKPTEGGHFGVRGMRERAKLIQADFRIHSEPGKGARVSVALPIDTAEAAVPPEPELSSRFPSKLLPKRIRP